MQEAVRWCNKLHFCILSDHCDNNIIVTVRIARLLTVYHRSHGQLTLNKNIFDEQADCLYIL
jgi:hypothetical protein